MDLKERLRELSEALANVTGTTYWFDDTNIIELNGWEGLLVWMTNGYFCQFSYKKPSVWSLTTFPYDIYGKRVWELDKTGSGSWKDV